MEFAKGETVTLKSGGPTMTVSDPKMEIGGLVEVVWFSKAGFLRRETFDEALLAAVLPRPVPEDKAAVARKL
jgi:uncharacterized protein YodC (DUF2158 family)